MEQRQAVMHQTFTNPIDCENLKFYTKICMANSSWNSQILFCASCNWKYSNFHKETELICLLLMLKLV